LDSAVDVLENSSLVQETINSSVENYIDRMSDGLDLVSPKDLEKLEKYLARQIANGDEELYEKVEADLIDPLRESLNALDALEDENLKLKQDLKKTQDLVLKMWNSLPSKFEELKKQIRAQNS